MSANVQVALSATGAQQVIQAFQQLSQALGQAQAAANQAVAGLQGSGNAAEQAGAKAQAAASKQSILGTAIKDSAANFATLITSGVQLFNMYDQLGDAQFNVQAATNALTRVQLFGASAQNQVNKLQAAGKTGTAEYAIAVGRLNLAHEREAVAKNNVANAQEDLNKAYANFIGQLIPTVISGISSIVSIQQSMKTATLAAAAANKTAAVASDGLGVASLGLKGKLAILAGVLALITAGLVMYARNVGGFRDMVNGMGVAIGNAIPPLKGFLNSLGQFGNIITGLLGGKVPQATKQASQGFLDMGENAVDAGADAQKAMQELYKDVDALAKNITDKLAKGFEEGPKAFQKAIDDIQKEIGFNLPQGILLPIQFTTNASDLQKQAEAALGGFVAALKGATSLQDFKGILQQYGETWIQALSDGMANQTPAVQAQVQHIIDIINTLMTVQTPAGFNALLGQLQESIKGLGNAADTMAPFVNQLGQNMDDTKRDANQMTGAVNGTSEAIQGMGDTIGNIGGMPFLPLRKDFDATNTSMTNFANTAQTELPKASKPAQDVKTDYDNLPTWIAKALGNAKTNIVSGLQALWQGAQPGLKLIESGLFDAWNRIINFQPEKAAIDLGGWLAKNVVQPVLDIKHKLETQEPIDWQAVFFGKSDLGLTDWIDKNVWQPIKKAFASTQGVLDQLIGQPIRDFFTNLPKNFQKIVVDPVFELAYDITQWFDDYITEPVKNWFSQFPDTSAFQAIIIDPIFDLAYDITQWFDDYIVQPIKDWFANPNLGPLNLLITPVLKLGVDIAAWLQDNIVAPITNFFANPFQSAKAAGGATGTIGFGNFLDPTVIGKVIPLIQQEFDKLVTGASTSFQQITANFGAYMGQLPGIAYASGIDPTAGAFFTLPAKILPALQTVVSSFASYMTQLAGGAYIGIDAVTGAFFTLPAKVLPAFQTIVSSFASYMTQLAGGAYAGIDKVALAFRSLVTKTTPAFGQLLTQASNQFNAIVNIANITIPKVGNAFRAMSTAAGTVFNAIRTAAASTFAAVAQAAASAASRVGSAMNSIRNSANSATGAVNQLRNAINSLQSKTVTITTVRREVIQRVYAARGFEGIVRGPTAFVAGEAGPEAVSIKPLTSQSSAIKSQFAAGRMGRKSTGGAGGTGEVSVKGEIADSTPVNIFLDGQLLTRTVQRRLLRFSDAMK